MDSPFSPGTSAAYKLIADRTEVECDLLSTEGNQVLLAVTRAIPLNQPVSLYIDRTALSEKLLHCFEDTLQDADHRYANAARWFNGQFCADPSCTPDLSDHPQLNKYQKAAVVRSFQGDTVIWGPPGTGKTHTIAAAIHKQIQQGRRVLLLSHANTAVDGAMEELADLLHDSPVYTDGRLIRMGTSQLTEYPMLSLDEIVRAKEAPLLEQIQSLDSQLTPLTEQRTKLLEIQNLQTMHEQVCSQLAEKEYLYHTQNSKLLQCQAKIDQGSNTLSALESEQRRLEKKCFQTRRVRKRIEEAGQKFRETEMYLLLQREEVAALQIAQNALLSEISQRKQTVQEYQQTITAALHSAGLNENSLKKELDALSSKIDEIEQQRQQLEQQLSVLRKQIIAEASVIGATLSMVFMSNDLRNQTYDALFIDEVSMAPLLPVFFAMGLIKSHCTLIGDFLQLPPIGTQSNCEPVKKWRNRSFFDVAGINTVNKAMLCPFVPPLSIQYRMNPSIAALSNKLFYGGMLGNGENTFSRVFSDQWVQEQPLLLIDTSDSKPWMNHGPNKQSRCNLHHAVLAATLAQHYLEYQRDGKGISIGVVVPYRAQKDLINALLDDLVGKESPDRKRIEVNTVHSFQGGEKDVILCDSVESDGLDTTWHFFDEGSHGNPDAHRMLNVAVTRAKCKFILLANTKYTSAHFSGRLFSDLLHLLQEHGALLPDTALGLDCSAEDEDYVLSRLTGQFSGESLEHYNQNGFWTRVIPDLQNARKRIIIFCPYVRNGRIERLLPLFEERIQAGVAIIVYTIPLNEHTPSYQATARGALRTLQQQGIIIRTRPKNHEKLLLIDDDLAWQGSLNLLSHKDTSEHMQRVVGKTAQKSLLAVIDTDNSTELAPEELSAPYCPWCGSPLVVRQARASGKKFYGCRSYPRCKYTQSLEPQVSSQ